MALPLFENHPHGAASSTHTQTHAPTTCTYTYMHDDDDDDDDFCFKSCLSDRFRGKRILTFYTQALPLYMHVRVCRHIYYIYIIIYVTIRYDDDGGGGLNLFKVRPFE